MAFDEKLASRIREAFASESDVAEKKMFGGIAFMIKGHMAVGIVQSDLMVRVGEDAFDAALNRPHARVMDFTGRPMRGFVHVDAAGIETGKALSEWLRLAAAHARSLPPKKPKKKSR